MKKYEEEFNLAFAKFERVQLFIGKVTFRKSGKIKIYFYFGINNVMFRAQ